MNKKIIVVVLLGLFLIGLLSLFRENTKTNCFGQKAYWKEKNIPNLMYPNNVAIQNDPESIYEICLGIPYGNNRIYTENLLPPQEPINKNVDEKTLKSMLDGANFCSVASDCTVVSYGCPFGCFNLVNKNADLADVEAGISEFRNANPSQCIYDCDRDPTIDEVACVQNKCIDTRYLSE